MTTVSQAEFARHQKWNRSSVTRARRTGRLVMVGDMVDLEASMASLASTADRIDVSERHAQERAAKAAAPQQPQEPPENHEDDIGHSYQAARAVKERYAALQAKADYELSIGKLLPRDVVDFAMSDYAATLRGLLENRADRLAPVLYPMQTMEEVHAAIAEADECLLREMADLLLRKAEAFGTGS
jgi:hypothetical protein